MDVPSHGQGSRADASQGARVALGPQAAEAAMVRVTPVDAVGLEERSASLATRSIKRDAKLFALDLAVRCCDLTTLEGSDTPGWSWPCCRRRFARTLRPDDPLGGGRACTRTWCPSRPRP